jgi:glycosyltransferase involved in cell wall biosynthesis
MHLNAKSIDRFIAPGSAYAQTMSDFLDVPMGQIEVIRVGLELSPPEPVLLTMTGPPVIGYLSRIAPEKGADILVEAFRILVQKKNIPATLHMAGKIIDPQYWKSICKNLAADGLNDRFVYHGEIPPHKKWEFLRRCHVVCFPSRLNESRGLAALEALAAGRPVVVGNCGAFTEMVGLTGGGLCVSGHDPRQWADAISNLLSAPDKLANMGKVAREGIQACYSAKAMVDKTEQLYTKIIRSTH